MFKYCNHKNHLSKMIGMFLSRKIDWINNNKLVSIKEVNTWDRKDIAIRFVDELLKDDVSVKIVKITTLIIFMLSLYIVIKQ